jgi:hypothetical protein
MKAATMVRAPGSIPLERPKQIVARADALLYLHLARPDLDKATKFLTEFGLLPAGRQEGVVHLSFFYSIKKLAVSGPDPRQSGRFGHFR